MTEFAVATPPPARRTPPSGGRILLHRMRTDAERRADGERLWPSV